MLHVKLSQVFQRQRYQHLLRTFSKEQAKATEPGDGRASSEGAEGCEVCGMLRPHAKGTQECLRRGEHPNNNRVACVDNGCSSCLLLLQCNSV